MHIYKILQTVYVLNACHHNVTNFESLIGFHAFRSSIVLIIFNNGLKCCDVAGYSIALVFFEIVLIIGLANDSS